MKIRVNEMDTKRKAIVVICLVVFILWLPTLDVVDDEIDRWADASYNSGVISPSYSGGWYEFYVSSDETPSEIVMIKNSTSREIVRTVALHDGVTTKSSMGGKTWWCVQDINYVPDIYERVSYYIQWYVYNVTRVYESWTWLEYNGTDWIEAQAYSYEYEKLLYLNTKLPAGFGEYTINEVVFNQTLYIDWFGFI